MFAPLLSLTLVSVTILLAFCALWSSKETFAENFFQYIGLWGFIITGSSVVVHILQTPGSTDGHESLLYGSILCYALGTAQKVLKHRARRRGKELA